MSENFDKSEKSEKSETFEKPLTGPQAAKLLGMKFTTFEMLVKRNIIACLPGLKSNRRFSRKELQRYANGERK